MNKSSNFKFSIITIVKNEKKHIEKTIISVLSQTYKNFEYIVLDGASTDGTQEIISRYKDNINTYISEQDEGIYEAMNKAIGLAKGEYLCFINANDFFYNDKVLEKINEELMEKPDVELLFGEGVFVSPINYEYSAKTDFSRHDNWYSFLKYPFLNHQSIFYRKDLFKKYGLYNTKFKVAADNYFNLNCILKHKCRTLYTSTLISTRTKGGFEMCNQTTLNKEKKKIRNEFFPYLSKLKFFIEFTRYFCPFLYQNIVSKIIFVINKCKKLNFAN